MTIQAGLTGPPLVPEYRVRVWSDRPGAGPDVVFANSGQTVPGAVVTPSAIPPQVDAFREKLPRRLWEIGGLPPDSYLRITVDGESCFCQTMPAAGTELRLLLGSCFYLAQDSGRLAMAYRGLLPQDRPHIRISCGDQVYMDDSSLPPGPTVLDRTLQRYREHWQDRDYGEYLRAGVMLFTPDDHEFWNDYPYSMPWLDRSWDGSWREHSQAAKAAFRAYQALSNPAGQSWFILDLGLVSLFIMDTRTDRGTGHRNGAARLFNPDQRAALANWSATLNKPGLLVSPMPFFQKPTGSILGLFDGDHNLLAWPDDARAIWRAVETATAEVLVLAGDIHQGRVLSWQTGSPGAVRVHRELVASPLSLLLQPFPKSLFGGRKVSHPSNGLQLDGGMGKRSYDKLLYATSKDHFALLRLSPVPTGVEVSVTARRTGSGRVLASELDIPGSCNPTFTLASRV